MSKCLQCNNFYGNPSYNMKCSYCYNNINKPSIEEMKNDFINKYLIKSDSMIKSIDVYLKKNLPKKKEFINELYETMLKPSNKFFFAEDILKIIKNTDVDISHMLASLVGDWWNISSSNGWSGYLVCYYGNFNEEIDVNHPIRMPHSILDKPSINL